MSITSTTPTLLLQLPPMLDVPQLAELLHRSVHTIRLDASRAPERLPPITRLRGHNRLLWRREDVIAWIDSHVTPPPTPEPGTPLPRRRRGRPTKAEQRGRSTTGGARHG